MKIKQQVQVKMSKKGVMWGYLVDIVFWGIILIVVLIIVWGLATGKIPALWGRILDTVRFF